MSVLITKMNGEQEPFYESKLDRSLKRAGASNEIRQSIITTVVSELREGMTTQEIYERAFNLLRQQEKNPVAARYSVKRAVLDLGPSGFPFEQFVAEILKTMGYTNVETGVAAQGKCAPHEVDVMGEHDGKHVAAEVKFHNSLGVKTDLKVALYVKARFDDLANSKHKVDEGWIITNTRFTRNAARYGHCTGMHLLGWDYPHKRGLEVLIDEAAVHPITALTTLSHDQKRALLDADIVLCRQMPKDDHDLGRYGIRSDQYEKLRQEIQELCKPHSAPEENTTDMADAMTETN